MKFRTEIEVAPWQQPIDYTNRITCLGSCFASNIARRLQRHKFNVVDSPTGILFNPVTIAQSVDMMLRASRGESVVNEEFMINLEGRVVNYDFHSSISGATPEEAMANMQQSMVDGGNALKGSDLIIITLGTAWCYEHRELGRVVANCHKQPSKFFNRRLLSVAEVVEALTNVVESVNGRVLFTVSPVRHIGEGVEDNSLSKAILRVAVSEVCAGYCKGVDYFPSYEIMMDDLRDYRFYDNDMVHPSSMAVDYIAEKFFSAALTDEAKSLMQRVQKVMSAAEHRPFDPTSEAYKIFCRKNLDDIAALSQVDFSEEKAHFERMLQINL
jgi:hypothetical protein